MNQIDERRCEKVRGEQELLKMEEWKFETERHSKRIDRTNNFVCSVGLSSIYKTFSCWGHQTTVCKIFNLIWALLVHFYIYTYTYVQLFTTTDTQYCTMIMYKYIPIFILLFTHIHTNTHMSFSIHIYINIKYTRTYTQCTYI